MTENLSLIEKYGAGTFALALVFVVFVLLVNKNFNDQKAEREENSKLLAESNKRAVTIQEEHNCNQVKALEKVAESNNNVASALELIRDMFVDRTNTITNKQDIMLSQLKTHCVDVSRIESVVSKMSESVLKTDERTKQCAEQRGK